MNWEPDEPTKAMMYRAEAENLWFHCQYADLWFSPEELRAAWQRDNFRWGSANWTLRPPSDKETLLRRNIEVAEANLKAFQHRLKARK